MDFLLNCYVLYDSINRITRPWGDGGHGGIDLGWNSALYTDEQNFDVYSAGYGEVVEIIDGKDNDTSSTGLDTYGNYVYIHHTDTMGYPNGLWTRYAHLEKNSLRVGVGDIVYPSTKIGRMGDSGNAYGIHLHFEVSTSYSTSGRFDPTPYLTNLITPNSPLYPIIPMISISRKKFPWVLYARKNRLDKQKFYF